MSTPAAVAATTTASPTTTFIAADYSTGSDFEGWYLQTTRAYYNHPQNMDQLLTPNSTTYRLRWYPYILYEQHLCAMFRSIVFGAYAYWLLRHRFVDG